SSAKLARPRAAANLIPCESAHSGRYRDASGQFEQVGGPGENRAASLDHAEDNLITLAQVESVAHGLRNRDLTLGCDAGSDVHRAPYFDCQVRIDRVDFRCRF